MTLFRTPLRIPPPRLLPLAILAMASLLVIKSGDIVRAATTERPVPLPPRMTKPLLHLAAVSSPPAPTAPPAPPRAPQPPAPPAPSAGAAQPMAPSGAAAPPLPDAAKTPLATEHSEPTPVTESERKLLSELRQRRLELDAREAALAAREATLNAVDHRLASRVEQLTALQHQLEDLEKERKARDEANWSGLVKTYEAMKPRDAATIFNDLDMPVLLPVIDRMKEAKLAPILSAMQPERARQATSELAQMRLKANRVDGKPQSSSAKALAGGPGG